MLKELSTAVVLTLIFSIGVGVLFVRTLIEMVELLFNGEIETEEDRKKGSQKLLFVWLVWASVLQSFLITTSCRN